MARERRAQRVKYNTHREEKPRSENKLLLIISEGTVTEKIYFEDLNVRYRDSIIDIDYIPNKHNDPIGLMEYTIKACERESLDNEKGDIAYCIFDRDNNLDKDIQEAQKMAMNSEYNIEIIISNPSFELWYLLHFIYSTAHFNAKEAENKLRNQHIKGYNKNKNYSKILEPNTHKAIQNAKNLERFHDEEQTNRFKRNPYTEVHKIFEKIKKHV